MGEINDWWRCLMNCFERWTREIQKRRDIYLVQLRNILGKHAAFNKTSNLENLAKKYDVKIIWSPKYHCELNPIEGFWCYSKGFVRKNNDQNFNELNNLIIASKEKFELSSLNAKL